MLFYRRDICHHHLLAECLQTSYFFKLFGTLFLHLSNRANIVPISLFPVVAITTDHKLNGLTGETHPLCPGGWERSISLTDLKSGPLSLRSLLGRIGSLPSWSWCAAQIPSGCMAAFCLVVTLPSPLLCMSFALSLLRTHVTASGDRINFLWPCQCQLSITVTKMLR